MADGDKDFGKILEGALSDPRFGEIFGMLKAKADSGELDLSGIGSMLGASGVADATPSGSFETSETMRSSEGSKPSETSGISGAASVSRTAENLSESADGGKRESASSVDAFSKIPDLMGLLGDGKKGLGKGKGFSISNHERLLFALKPYLSDSKKNAVETVLKAAKLGDILEVISKK